jgi:hypothetical protein
VSATVSSPVFAPAFLSGFRLGDWLRLLAKNSFAVDGRFLGRAITATVGAAVTSVVSRFEPSPCLTSIQLELWKSPVFVLGLQRSGTTYLQSLLSCNAELCAPTRLDCYNPHTLQCLHRLGLARLLACVSPKKRMTDNVLVGWNTPDEDDVALHVLTGDGPKLGVVFPRRREHYGQRSPLNPVWDGAAGWRQALTLFTRKLVALRGKRLVLKSPLHTIAIPEILAVFPAARFVTIFRNPIDHVRSLLASRARSEWCALQVPPADSLQSVAEQSASMVQRYFQTRDLVPAQNLVECTYESLVQNPLEVLERIHLQLKLGGFESLRTEFAHKFACKAYARNRHTRLPREEEALVWVMFQPLVECGMYAPL